MIESTEKTTKTEVDFLKSEIDFLREQLGGNGKWPPVVQKVIAAANDYDESGDDGQATCLHRIYHAVVELRDTCPISCDGINEIAKLEKELATARDIFKTGLLDYHGGARLRAWLAANPAAGEGGTG